MITIYSSVYSSLKDGEDNKQVHDTHYLVSHVYYRNELIATPSLTLQHFDYVTASMVHLAHTLQQLDGIFKTNNVKADGNITIKCEHNNVFLINKNKIVPAVNKVNELHNSLNRMALDVDKVADRMLRKSNGAKFDHHLALTNIVKSLTEFKHYNGVVVAEKFTKTDPSGAFVRAEARAMYQDDIEE